MFIDYGLVDHLRNNFDMPAMRPGVLANEYFTKERYVVLYITCQECKSQGEYLCLLLYRSSFL